jgi:hypothetical protein
MANTGRKKMKPEARKVNLCTTVSPEIYEDIVTISEKRVVSIARIVEACLTTSTCLEDLKGDAI